MDTYTPSLPALAPGLLYILHSGQISGTERMAIATLQQLGSSYDSQLLAPPGLLLEFARSKHIPTLDFHSRFDLMLLLIACMRRQQRLQADLGQDQALRLISTNVANALLAHTVARLLGLRLRHLHLVHDVQDMVQVHRKWLAHLDLELIASSECMAKHLLAEQLAPQRIHIIENFLTTSTQQRRTPYQNKIRRILSLVSFKRQAAELLTSMLYSLPLLQTLRFEVINFNQDEELEQPQVTDLPIQFHGVHPQITQMLINTDVLLQTGTTDACGLSVLEAMAAGVLVLAPDSGPAANFIEHGVSGFLYRANDPVDLGRHLLSIAAMPSTRLNHIVQAARLKLHRRFSASARIADYARLLQKEA